MNNRKSYLQSTMRSRYTCICLLLLLSSAACSLNLDVNEQDTITRQDIEAVSQIIGESLSDENSGIIGSFYDAITDISSSGFVSNSVFRGKLAGHDDNTGRGDETDINYRYLTETGEHELSFRRIVNLPDYSKEVTDTLRYIYKDPSGQFIADLNLVDQNSTSIRYTASRDGEIQSQTRTSFFSRADTFIIDGLEPASAELFADGVHHGTGLFQSVTTADSIPFERFYQLEVNFLNFTINKSVLNQNISLEQAVSGVLSYSLVIEDPNNTNVSRTISGSLDFVGDGTATIRFRNAPDLFQVNLDNGTVSDQRREFEGRIISVNLQRTSFTLANGITIHTGTETYVSPESDLFTLDAVQTALQQGQFVRAEGEGNTEGQIFKATEVEYEVDDDNDDENDDLEFEQLILSVDLVRRTFTLADGTEIGTDDRTMIDSAGDYFSLEEVAEAITNSLQVSADGDARYVDTDTLNFIANDVEFEIADDINDEEGIVNFGGIVNNVNLPAGTFTLENGAVIQVTEDTQVTGDLISLQAVYNALNEGQVIEADGEGVENTENQDINLIAREVEFEVEG